MIDENAIQQLIDRAAITDVLHTYAAAVDTRDWDLFATLFAPRVFIDFRSFDPDRYREVSVEELVAISRHLGGFEATQHLLGNHRQTIDCDRATSITYLQAGHFMKRGGEDFACMLYGYYTFELARTASGWKIDRYGLTVTAQSGEPRVFEWVGLS